MDNNTQNQTPSSNSGASAPQATHESLYVQVSSPDRTLFEGEAKSISSYNDHGPFDVLSQHENFISVIQRKIVVFDEEHKPQEFLLHNGVLRVVKNQVDVFIGF